MVQCQLKPFRSIGCTTVHHMAGWASLSMESSTVGATMNGGFCLLEKHNSNLSIDLQLLLPHKTEANFL